MSKRILSSKDPMLAVAVIRGLHDDTRRQEVSFAIRGMKTSFKSSDAIDLIKAADRSIGDFDPLKVREDRPRFSDTSPYYAMPPPEMPIAAASMMAPRPTSPDWIHPG